MRKFNQSNHFEKKLFTECYSATLFQTSQSIRTKYKPKENGIFCKLPFYFYAIAKTGLAIYFLHGIWSINVNLYSIAVSMDRLNNEIKENRRQSPEFRNR